jgi:uncharacterized membrane protein
MLAEITATITQSDPSTLRSELTFSTNSGDSLSEKMKIASGGNVGIGTTSPTTKLYVDSGESTFNRGNSDGAIARFRGSNAEQAVIGTVTSWFDSNVGIGTTSPIAKLTLPLEEETGYKIAFKSANTTHAGISTVDQSGAGLYIGANSFVNSSGVATYSDSAYPSSGIYFDGWNTDSMAFYTAASGAPSEKMRITSGGNVGIGTTSPASKLDVNGGSSYPDIRISATGLTSRYMEFGMDSAVQHSIGAFGTGSYLTFKTAGTDKVVIDASGNVGIGTTSPVKKLQVHGAVYSNIGLYSDHSYSSNRNWSIDTNAFGSGNWGGLAIKTSTGVGLDPSTTRFGIDYLGNVGIGTTSPEGKLNVVADNGSTASAVKTLVLGGGTDTTGNGQYIQFRSSSNATLGSQISGSRTGAGAASDLKFYTTASDSVVRERMVINSSGNVGIGTTSPQTELHVKGNNGWGEVRVEGQTFASGHGASLEFYSEGTALADIYSSTDKHLYFRTNGTTERMRITASGNVGIGTTSPGEKLDVVGNIKSQYNGNNYSRLGQNSSGGYIQAYSGAVEKIMFRSYGDSFINGGNVGIGTTSPSEKLEVNGNVKADNFIGGNDAGVYTFSDTVDASASEDIFSISCQNGAAAFKVTFVCSTSGYSVAKTYEVVHSYNNTPIFFKVVDTGAYNSSNADHDFDVSFTDSNSNTGVTCEITNNSTTINADIVTTVFLGGSPTAITVTAL